jgi:predicted Rossmann fold flavoprotein
VESIDVLIIGGGAAGFFCGCELLQMNPNLKVHIWEKSNKTLAKVRISGGGRCNVTHHILEPRFLIKKYPRGQKYLKSKFQEFNVTHTIEWFQKKGIPLKTESDGRMFPITDSSETIACELENTFNKLGGILKLKNTVSSLTSQDSFFHVQDLFGNSFIVHHVVFAMGGLTHSQAQWIQELTQAKVTPMAPSLFTFNVKDPSLHKLMGLSVPQGRIKLQGKDSEYVGPILVTHWGISGPAVLATSAWHALDLNECHYQQNIFVSWVSEKNEDIIRNTLRQELQERANKSILNAGCFKLPKRLWNWLVEKSKIEPNQNSSQLKKEDLNRLVEHLIRTPLKIEGKTTYKEEFVTAGGIDVEQLSKSGHLNSNDRIYFIGEMLNVDGITGGFNFQASWSTAHVAAKSIIYKNRNAS